MTSLWCYLMPAISGVILYSQGLVGMWYVGSKQVLYSCTNGVYTCITSHYLGKNWIINLLILYNDT